MRLSWPEHLQTARTLELSADGQRGEALALMGIALLMLAQDLLLQESAGAMTTVAKPTPGPGEPA